MSRTVTAKTIAWLTSYRNPAEIMADDDDAVMEVLAFSRNESMGEGENAWVRVGAAEITVVLVEEQELVSNKVESLRAEKKHVLAQAQAAATRIESSIQELLAISHDGSAA
jgi:hypothetical protein